MKLDIIAVIGAGLMGTGIAQVLAVGGYTVYVKDISMDILQKSRTKIQRKLKESVAKERLSEHEAKSVMARVTFTEDLKIAAMDADFIIEAVPENLELKRKVFGELDKVAKPPAIFASNTSQLSIGLLASGINRPSQVIGTHWFFPPQVMKLIEVVITPETSRETLDITLELCKKIGKETVFCKDTPGFITTRAIAALNAECLRIHAEGIASIEDIDKAMRLAFNHPLGPFQLVDMSGVDVVYHSLESLAKVYGDRFKPTREMKQMVESGNLGQKTGKGFYEHGPK